MNHLDEKTKSLYSRRLKQYQNDFLRNAENGREYKSICDKINLGDGDCAYHIGESYYLIEGETLTGCLKAYDWFKLSAQFNCIKPYYYLGKILWDRLIPIRHSNREALKWFKKAAATGNSSAYFYLGQIYEKGIGTHIDVERARYWYQKAYESSDKRCLEPLNGFNTSHNTNIRVFSTNAMP